MPEDFRHQHIVTESKNNDHGFHFALIQNPVNYLLKKSSPENPKNFRRVIRRKKKKEKQ